MKIRYMRSYFSVKIGKKFREVGVLHPEGDDKRRERQQRLADDYGGNNNVRYLRTEFYKEIESN